jgi:hypothetical protein
LQLSAKVQAVEGNAVRGTVADHLIRGGN